MTDPLSGQGIAVEAPDPTKPRRAGKRGDVLPFLIPLEDFPRRQHQLLVDSAVLLDTPHAIYGMSKTSPGEARPSLAPMRSTKCANLAN